MGDPTSAIATYGLAKRKNSSKWRRSRPMNRKLQPLVARKRTRRKRTKKAKKQRKRRKKQRKRRKKKRKRRKRTKRQIKDQKNPRTRRTRRKIKTSFKQSIKNSNKSLTTFLKK